MAGRMEGKIAIITGAGKPNGIGAATARTFCREGAKVMVVGVSGQQKEVAESIGKDCVHYQADLTKSVEVQAMFKEAVARFGKINVLINNIGYEGRIVPTEDYPEDEFDKVWAVNVRSVFLSMRYAIPLMREAGGGSIVTTSSMSSVVAFPNMPAYCASKSAVSSLTKVVAVENAGKGIRANVICPGPVVTDMTAGMDAAYIEAVNKAVPLNRMASPAEVANLALFLASDESSYITGASIMVDGGYTTL